MALSSDMHILVSSGLLRVFDIEFIKDIVLMTDTALDRTFFLGLWTVFILQMYSS